MGLRMGTEVSLFPAILQSEKSVASARRWFSNALPIEVKREKIELRGINGGQRAKNPARIPISYFTENQNVLRPWASATKLRTGNKHDRQAWKGGGQKPTEQIKE